MKILYPRRFLLPFILMPMMTASVSRASGIYMNFQTWFASADTSRVRMILEQSHLQAEYEDASLFNLETIIRLDDRSTIKLGVLYPVIRRPDRFYHGLGDGAVTAHYRLYGDTLNVSGLFLRGDIRIPTGSRSMGPFSYASLD
ncbi:MAG: hypothetical protein JXB45_06330, partial [Candidatus Krumholzibacteriota bacterium]|nr:hypothetical protein [Candidatus Krumholzibacteriota bacterium]